MKQALFIGAIASVLSINAFAETTTSTVTSKNYVDAQDALKQNKIPAAGTNASTPGETVVTYTTTGNGVIGERGIFNYDTDYDWDNHSVETGHEGDLVTAGDVMPQLDYLSGVYQVDKYCTEWSGTPYTDENCLLWYIGDNIMGPYNLCQTDSDCDGCDGCINGLCKDDGRCDT
ncbi:MAG: hypothetical protein J5620_00385 [Alphaproteobacteria bacterium]|nr:hypothetical protein [Alphaproteobacteria bacterium]